MCVLRPGVQTNEPNSEKDLKKTALDKKKFKKIVIESHNPTWN
jgi:hypothetical protein